MKKLRKRNGSQVKPKYERVEFTNFSLTPPGKNWTKRDESKLDPLEESVDEFTVTNQDLSVLGTLELNGDGDDDDLLKNRITPVDFTGKDMDIPDDKSENTVDEQLDEDNEDRGPGAGNNKDDILRTEL